MSRAPDTAAGALVGPLPTVAFADGSRIAYDCPKDTLDNRFAACRDHHVACDCREAVFAEDAGEHRAAMDDARMVIAHLIDAPCPPDRRRGCRTCEAALTTWLNRFDAVWPRRRNEGEF